MKRYIVILVLLVIALNACKLNNKLSNKVERKIAENGVVKFPFVKVPSIITNRDELSLYLLESYWKDFLALNNNKLIGANVNGVDSVEFNRAFLRYTEILLLNRYNPDKVQKSINKLFIGLDSLASRGDRLPLFRVIKLSDELLYMPNSPYLNEQIYRFFLLNICNSKNLDSLEKMQYEYALKMANLNVVGEVCNDFSFTSLSISGLEKRGSLHKIKSNYTLIFFNNPDCSTCGEIKAQIEGSYLKEMVSRGELTILAMFIDNDFDLWRKHRENFPKEWIYACDKSGIMGGNTLYGIRAIPTIYLIDKDKRLLLKDVKIEELLNFLSNPS